MIPYSRWVVVTGCGSGFGLLTAQQLLAKGYGVIAVCRTEDGCQRLRSTVTSSARLRTVQCDITVPGDRDRLRSELAACHRGDLWALVNNAGTVIPGYTDYLTDADFRNVMEVNFFGAVNVTRLCLLRLKESRGRIVNVSSTCGLVALPGNGPYNASKFALRAFSDTLRRELSAWGIRVALVAPGVMRTPINQKYLDVLQGKLQQAPEDVRHAYGEAYQRRVFSMTSTGMTRMAQDPQVAVNAIVHAVTSRRPKELYLPGWDAGFFNFLHKSPTWFSDRFVKMDWGDEPAAMRQRGTRVIEFSQLCEADQATTWARFLDVLWKRGAGLTPRMVLEEEGDATGNGCTRWIPLFGKAGIREGITATDCPYRLYYRVKNPSWRTFPVDYHQGWVSFVPWTDTTTQVVWTIELTPKRGMTGLVLGIIRFVIPRYLRVLARECQRG